MILCKALLLFSAFCAVPALAEIREISVNDDFRQAVAALSPGDHLVLRSGTYSFDSRLNVTVVGLREQPIVIRAREGESVLIEMNSGLHNVLEIQDSRYLKIHNLGFRGGSHGIRLMNSDYVTIQDCEVYETGDVAISANSGGTYEGLVIRGNHIHHTNSTGEGMYLGCNNDTCRVMNSLIEFNYVHHTNGPTVEQGDGIELKEGSAGNIIRHNVIHDTNYPGIITYGTAGNGPANIIEGNLIWGTNDFAIQSAADSVIRNNIILGESIGLQPHQAGSPSNQRILHNTVVAEGNGIEVRGVSGAIVIANNAIYSQSGSAIRLISGSTGLVTVAGNVGSGGLFGAEEGYIDGNGVSTDFINGHFTGMPPIDLFPAQGSALVAAGSSRHVPAYDFNGDSRQGAADAGAYRFHEGGNPGWALSPAFKILSDHGALPKLPTHLVPD